MFFSSVVSFMLWSASWLFNHLVSETIMFRLKAAGLAEEMDINWCVFCLADGSDWCQQRFCECDRAAIDCMTQSSYNSSLRGLAASKCSATNHTGNLIRGETAGSLLICTATLCSLSSAADLGSVCAQWTRRWWIEHRIFFWAYFL